MLKAVRFDLEEHAELIEFVENYRDKKNKPNHSEAIRMLMQKGLEVLNKPEESPQPTIDIESLKAEIFNQLMAQVSSMNITQPPKKETVTQPPQPVIQKQTPKSAPSKTVAVNPLLANILGNADR